jgi:microsomal dipeptidase-like Zn-dependent dipeptidase
MKRRIPIALGLLGLSLAAGLALAPGWIEGAIQGVVPHDPYPLSEAARAHHAGLVVADWHADSLLWRRDLLRESDRGHVDFPRLARGNVAIQMFTAVTKAPRGLNYESNDAGSDNVTLLAAVQRWPLRTWSSLLERALHQAEKLADFARRAPERVALVRSAADLRRVMAARERGPERPVAALLGIEGAHALEGELANLARLDEAGFRMVGLHHFFDNRLGGSLHGESRAGLTPFGREVVRALEGRRILVDVAHSSPRVVEDVLAMATRPVVVSHTGLTAVCPSPRNLPDALMQRIAAAGGIVAIGYWDAVCDTTPAGVVASLRAAIDLLGEDHVALGSDFDGGTTTTFDTSELAVLTQTMLEAGFGEREIAKVMGGNTLRFLLAQLPPE